MNNIHGMLSQRFRRCRICTVRLVGQFIIRRRLVKVLRKLIGSELSVMAQQRVHMQGSSEVCASRLVWSSRSWRLCQTCPGDRQTKHETRTMSPEVTMTNIDHASRSTLGLPRTDLFESLLERLSKTVACPWRRKNSATRGWLGG